MLYDCRSYRPTNVQEHFSIEAGSRGGKGEGSMDKAPRCFCYLEAPGYLFAFDVEVPRGTF